MMRQTIACLAVAVALLACQDRGITPPVDDPAFGLAAGRPVLIVTGGGSVVREDIEGAPRETYGFRAQVDAEGNAWGEAEVHFPSDDVKMHIAVRCLVVERNVAWMSGPVTRSDDPATPVGRVFVWQVQDNGEGQGAPPDSISSFFFLATGNYEPDACLAKPRRDMVPWDNGGVRILTPGMPNLADLVGTWDATSWICINLANPADTQSLVAADSRIRLTIAPNGRHTTVFWRPGSPGEIWENTAGWMDVVNGVVRVSYDGSPMVIEAALDLTGNIWRVELDANVCHWDDDDEEDPSHLVMELRRKRTGILIDDVAGVWDAIVWRYTSTDDPAVTLDALTYWGPSYSVVLTITLDSRGYFAIGPDGWTSQVTTLLFDGNQLLARDGGESQSFVFSLKRDTLSFSGLQEVDFDQNGTQDPAMLEAVLVRR
jgi:hypothetical protein